MRNKFTVILSALMLAAAVCGAAKAAYAAKPARTVPADLTMYPQRADAYMPEDPDKPVISEERQRELAEAYLAKRYAPWTNARDLAHLGISFETVAEEIKECADKALFDRKGRAVPRSVVRRLMNNGRLDRLTRDPRPAVLLEPEDVRMLPTSRRFFSDADSALGRRGLLADDVLQSSSIKPGEPLAFYGLSADSRWAFVANDCVVGWIPKDALVMVDDAFMKRCMSAPHVAAVRDNIPYISADGRMKFRIKLGAVLPSEDGRPLMPVRGSGPFAELRPISGESWSAFPAAFTPRNALTQVGELLGERYGWGGLDGLRDCSAMTRDLLAPFGIWLPRNSGDQGTFGKVTELADVPASEREALLLKTGVPFATLVHMPGHIMLYIGERDGRPLLLHNMWGLRRNMPNGKSGRFVVGKCVITTLRLGEELLEKGAPLFADRIRAFAFPAETAEDQEQAK